MAEGGDSGYLSYQSGFSDGQRNVEDPPRPTRIFPQPAPLEATEVDAYPMNRGQRSKFIIFSHENFKSQMERPGTHNDAECLKIVLTNVGFDVTLHRDLTFVEMLTIMRDVGQDNHDQQDCFGVAVLSHGLVSHGDGFWASDEPIQIENFVAHIKNSSSLSGKPKLFFFQADRGKVTDLSRACSDADSDTPPPEPRSHLRVPHEADFLYAYSTTPGHVSQHDGRTGSWFIQTLCTVLSDVELRKKLDLVRLLTRVNHLVVVNFTKVKASDASIIKQVPSIVSMLTKDLYFWSA